MQTSVYVHSYRYVLSSVFYIISNHKKSGKVFLMFQVACTLAFMPHINFNGLWAILRKLYLYELSLHSATIQNEEYQSSTIQYCVTCKEKMKKKGQE